MKISVWAGLMTFLSGFFGSPGLLAKAVDACDQRIDGKCGNVVYCKARI